MSREIKFRVWDKYRKEMISSEALENNTDNYFYYYTFYENGLKFSKEYPSGDNFVLTEIMQYTGLKDKNGKEIYEGDIVAYSVKGFKKVNKTIMTFNEEHGAYLFGIYEGVKMPCGKKTRMNKYTRKSVNNVEVIGNIYENPELLEGDTE